MWRQLPVCDDIGDATEPKLARPAAVEGGPTQRAAWQGRNPNDSLTNSQPLSLSIENKAKMTLTPFFETSKSVKNKTRKLMVNS